MRELYKELLPLFGVTIMGTAKNGKEAVTLFKNFNKKPDFIIMDYRMPIKNGIEAMKEILQIDNKSKIIFASADQGVEDLARKKGAIGFMTKPFKIEDLFDLIKPRITKKCLEKEKKVKALDKPTGILKLHLWQQK